MKLTIISLVIFFYITASLFLFSSCKRSVRWLSIALLLFASQKYLIYKYVGGAFFAPELPSPVLLLMELLYGALILLFFLLLLKDACLLLLWLSRSFGASWALPIPQTRLKFGLLALALSLGLGVWGTWQSIRVPDIHTVELRLANLPPGLDGFSIVQLTDLHIGSILNREWLQQVVDKTNSVSPDLIVLTGDAIDGRVEDLAEEVAPFAGLRAKHGVYGVTGNHEHYWNGTEWSAFLEELQVTMLDNTHRVLTIGEDKLVLAGISDPVERRFGGEGPNIVEALAGAPDAPRILLGHRPSDAPSHAPYVDVHLAGHTHGGMVFFLRPLIALFNNGFVAGEYTVGSMKLYVSPGAGVWSGFSFRIGVPSAITRLVLRAG
ncbi:MAG: metallophosphoesterase [Desulfobulbaceae bacterium]|nr:metallophosphoesterase [Desulfobulbaceae bacterium]